MNDSKIQQIFHHGWNDYCNSFQPSEEQSKTAHCIMNCKSGAFGYNISVCEECCYVDFHANSCRNRNSRTARQSLRNSGLINAAVN